MQDLINREFNLRSDLVYLNHAGVSPWPNRTVKAVHFFAEENMREGSFRYPHWVEVETELRRQAQLLINAPSKDDIALLKNTSEALSVVAYGLPWQQGDNIVSSDQEFPSNRIVWESLSPKGVEFREADLGSASTPEDALFSLVDGRTRLITISSVEFSTGLRMDLERIGAFCRDRGILFCVDAIQSLGALEFDVQKIQADFVMADGHKWMLGPEGLAIFYCNPDIRSNLSLTQYGWHMVEDLYNFDRKDWKIAHTARCFECGSANMLGVHALHASLSLLLEAGIKDIEKAILTKTEYLFRELKSIPALKLVTSEAAHRCAGIVTFRHLKSDNSALYQYLMEKNVMCAFRSGGIRLSPHFYTPEDKIDYVIALLKQF
jgi:selenocysteine lyase/cysteine desulfurase